uniref:hypothetical protein n=1 Tax=Hylemonella sp. TaxID=2066020 RepID=UPI0035AFC415
MAALGTNLFLGAIVVAVWQIALLFVPLFVARAALPGVMSRAEIALGLVLTLICYRFFKFLGARRYEQRIRRAGLIGENDL